MIIHLFTSAYKSFSCQPDCGSAGSFAPYYKCDHSPSQQVRFTFFFKVCGPRKGLTEGNVHGSKKRGLRHLKQSNFCARYTRRKRRRANHTRCQLAIRCTIFKIIFLVAILVTVMFMLTTMVRNMEAQGLASHDNSGFSGGEEGGGQGGKVLPKSAR